MKLLHVLMGSARGGCERNCLMLCRRLSSAEHDVLVVGSRGEMSSEFETSGATVTHLDLKSGSWLRTLKPVREHARKTNPTGAIIWHGLVDLPQLLYALRDHDIPIAVHGGNPAHTMPRWVDWKFRLLGRLFPTRQLPTYACCSQFVADSFEHSAYLRRFPRVVIPNGVEPVNGEGHQPRAIAPGEPFVVGTLARLDAIKDHSTLLRAFAQLLQSHPRARLEVAGDGDRRQALEALAVELGVARSVTFLGMVRDVYGTMRGWDVFAYATTEREGLGNALAEAMTFGLPCVVTEVGPIREVVGEDAARLVPPRDAGALARAMSELASSLDRRRELGSRGRQRAEREFSADVFAERYGRLLWPATRRDLMEDSTCYKQ